MEKASRGILRLAKEFQASWVGGDISRSNQFFISIALLGEAKRPVLRTGARAGDWIYVTGKLGGSISGKHLTFTPRIQEGKFLAAHFRPTSMIDISDGFIQDLEHILSGSKAGARVDLEKIPISAAAKRKAGAYGHTPLQSALSDGEDFELLFTLPRQKGAVLEKAWRGRFSGVALTRAGEITANKGRIEWRELGKTLRKLWFQKKGFTHF
jgi:thiamine-monophosphate kinase